MPDLFLDGIGLGACHVVACMDRRLGELGVRRHLAKHDAGGEATHADRHDQTEKSTVREPCGQRHGGLLVRIGLE